VPARRRPSGRNATSGTDARTAGRRSRRRLVFWLLAFALSTAATLAVAEVVLWFLPVESSLRSVPVDERNPVFRARPHLRFAFSRGWDFKIPNRGRTNNAGYVNDRDYAADGPRPLIAVIGDSYIEAKMVRFADTVQGRLAAALGERGRVYSFAFSGAPLSQYAVWARHAWETYRPDGLVIAVIDNDFDESLARYRQGPGFHHYVERADGELELRLVPFEPSWAGQLVIRSALARYLVFHLHVLEAWNTLKAQFVREGSQAPGVGALVVDAANPTTLRQVGAAAPAGGDARETLSRRALAAFFRDLALGVGLPPERILFAVDAERGAIYRNAAPDRRSFFAVMRGALVEEARSRGHAVLDLEPVFADDFARHGRRFDWEFDPHWSDHGHAVLTAAVMRSEWWRQVAGER
jgi:hypothetical protein